MWVKKSIIGVSFPHLVGKCIMPNCGKCNCNTFGMTEWAPAGRGAVDTPHQRGAAGDQMTVTALPCLLDSTVNRLVLCSARKCRLSCTYSTFNKWMPCRSEANYFSLLVSLILFRAPGVYPALIPAEKLFNYLEGTESVAPFLSQNFAETNSFYFALLQTQLGAPQELTKFPPFEITQCKNRIKRPL